MTTLRRQLLMMKTTEIRHIMGRMFGSTFRITLATIGLVLGVLYIIQVSAITATGYDLATLERQIEELKRENQRLSLQIATHRSMTNIEKRIADLELVSVDAIEYLRSGDAVVARR